MTFLAEVSYLKNRSGLIVAVARDTVKYKILNQGFEKSTKKEFNRQTKRDKVAKKVEDERQAIIRGNSAVSEDAPTVGTITTEPETCSECTDCAECSDSEAGESGAVEEVEEKSMAASDVVDEEEDCLAQVDEEKTDEKE